MAYTMFIQSFIKLGLLGYIHAYLCYDCYSMIAFSSVQNALCKEHYLNQYTTPVQLIYQSSTKSTQVSN